MKKANVLKLLKFLLQILVAAVTSWGTASGYNATLEASDQASDTLSVDCFADRSYDIGARNTDIGADSISLNQAA